MSESKSNDQFPSEINSNGSSNNDDPLEISDKEAIKYIAIAVRRKRRRKDILKEMKSS